MSIVRELLLGPKRFAALQRDVVGIGPTILARRLDGLASKGVLRRTKHGGDGEWYLGATTDDGSLLTRQEIIDHTLLKRTGTPADVARSVLFLLAGAQYVTGQILAVDGGRSAHL